MRITRILTVFVALLAAGVVAFAAFLKSIDPAEYRDLIAEQVKQATGRDLTLAGEVELAVSLTPTITVSDVSFANAAWGSRPQMVTARRVEARIELLPLISGNINVKRLVLVELDILLETDAEGRGNWEFEIPAAETSNDPAATSSFDDAVIPTVREILITGGRLTYKDGQTGETSRLVVDRLSSGAEDISSPLRVALAGAYNGNSFSAKGVLGPIAQLAGGEPYSVDLRAEAGGATLSVEGVIGQPMSFKGLDLVIGVKGDNIATLSPLVGRELPAFGPYNVRLRLTDPDGRYRISDLAAELGEKDKEFLAVTGTVLDATAGAGLDLSLTLEGRALETLGKFVGLDLPPAGPVAATAKLTDPDGRYRISGLAAEVGEKDKEFLAVTGTVLDATAGAGLDLSLTLEGRALETLGKIVGLDLPPAGPVAATGKLTDRGRVYAFEDVKATVGESDLGGKVSINVAGARPLIVAEVTSSLLDLGALLSSEGKTNAARAGSNGRAGSAGDRDRVFSDEPLPLDELKAADATLTFRGKRVAVEGAVFEDVALELSLEEGALAVHLVGSDLSADVSFDARPAVPILKADVDVRRLDIGRLLSAMQITDLVEGESDIAVHVRGSGASARAIMGGLNGDATLVMGEGRIASRYVDFLAADLVQVIGPSASNGAHTEFNCFVSRFELENGLATSKAMLFDTQRITVVGEGEINLGSEELDLVLKPKPKEPSLLSLATPILVGGTLADPSVGPDTLAVVKDAAGAVIGAAATGGIGLILPFLSAGSADKNPCIAAVAEARSAAGQTAGTISPASAVENHENGNGGLEGLLEDVGNAIRGLFGSD